MTNVPPSTNAQINCVRCTTHSISADGRYVKFSCVDSCLTEPFGSFPCAFNACPDLLEGDVARGRRVIGERRESAIVRGAELGRREEFCGLPYAVANLIRLFDRRIDRIDHAYKHNLIGLHMLSDDT